MPPLRACLASQTPPVRFLAGIEELAARYPDLQPPYDLAELQEGVDYQLTTGGVPVMLRDLLRTAMERGLLGPAAWVALNPSAPGEVRMGDTSLRTVYASPANLRNYAAAKEKMWREVHGLSRERVAPSEFAGFTHVNYATAEAMLAALPAADVGFVHDFQLIQVGGMMGLSAPVVLRWHIPFQPEGWGRYFRTFAVRALESFDAVIVSCRRDLEGLIRSGYRGRARQVYPYIDPGTVREPTRAEAEQFAALADLPDDAPLAVCVSRMDPIKGQDRAVAAMEQVVRKLPEARLVFVGNGSFTSSARGLGLSKGPRWRARLEAEVAERGLGKHVTFTGYIAPPLLQAAYARASVVVQPSVVEGFGLTAVEAWMHGKPVVVSRGAGASELVLDGVNGHTHAPDDAAALAGHMLGLLTNTEEAARMGRRGREAAVQCHLERGAQAESAVLQEAYEAFVKG